MNSRPKLTTLMVGGIAVCLVTAVWLIARASATQEVSPTSDLETSANGLTVTSAVARSEQWPQTIEAFGNIVPWDEMIVSAQVEGHPLVELRVNVGDQVRSGQVLARFDTDKLRADVRRLRAEVEQATAEVGQANAERERALQLADSGGVSEQEVMQRVTAARVAAARLHASHAQLSARELDLQRSDVIAPDDGTISTRNAQTGMVGTPGLELFRIIRRDRLEWRGDLTATQLSRAALGQQVLLSLPDGATARARIRQLAPAMNMQTRQATLYADIEPGGSARAGTYVNGRIVLGRCRALVVPASSIVVRDGYSVAFKVASEGKEPRVTQQRVEVGRRMGTDVEILTGLSEGERVVAQGAGFLDDGDSVRVVSRADEESHGSSDFQ
jgi:RND family efflux transporter MFP subunit